jgi:hypothetical protein
MPASVESLFGFGRAPPHCTMDGKETPVDRSTSNLAVLNFVLKRWKFDAPDR